MKLLKHRPSHSEPKCNPKLARYSCNENKHGEDRLKAHLESTANLLSRDACFLAFGGTS